MRWGAVRSPAAGWASVGPISFPQHRQTSSLRRLQKRWDFAGSIAVLAGYALLVAAGFGIAIRSRDVFRKFLAFGLTIVIAVQSIIILAGVLRLFPVTGITLPFMSYGGSSLLANMVLVALLVRTSHGERT